MSRRLGVNAVFAGQGESRVGFLAFLADCVQRVPEVHGHGVLRFGEIQDEVAALPECGVDATQILGRQTRIFFIRGRCDENGPQSALPERGGELTYVFFESFDRFLLLLGGVLDRFGRGIEGAPHIVHARAQGHHAWTAGEDIPLQTPLHARGGVAGDAAVHESDAPLREARGVVEENVRVKRSAVRNAVADQAHAVAIAEKRMAVRLRFGRRRECRAREGEQHECEKRGAFHRADWSKVHWQESWTGVAPLCPTASMRFGPGRRLTFSQRQILNSSGLAVPTETPLTSNSTCGQLE